MSEVKLKPCMMCKSRDVIKMMRKSDLNHTQPTYYVKCQNCKAWSGEWLGGPEAIKAWNQGNLSQYLDYKDKKKGNE